MSNKPKILYIGDLSSAEDEVVRQLQGCYQVDVIDNPVRARSTLEDGVVGIYISSQNAAKGLELARLLNNERILEGMPDGVALLCSDNSIRWANDCLKQWIDREDLIGEDFYRVFGNPEILGPDFCPFHTALATEEASSSTLRCVDNRYYHVHCVPFQDGSDSPDNLIVTIRDVTFETLQQQKMAAIHKAGIALADLTAEEVFQMQVEDRIDLLKSNIIHYTKDLLSFDVVEIRLLAQETGELVPILSAGIDSAAAKRKLYARPTAQGVTGFVAATGKSYLCEDTAEDPLYIEGCVGAKSSLTVPLIQHDEIIGTFNVESPEPRAFTENDLQFLEIFSRDVANALNTLELLVAQQANTAQASVEAIHREVALPVDEILNDAVNVMETYIGHDSTVVDRLQRILKNARDIKQLIHKVGQEMAPAEAVPACAQIESRPGLQLRRVLVVDDDGTVRSAAHNLLDRFGCVVETAHNGEEAISMFRNVGTDIGYDVVISDIKLADMSGYDLLIKLKEQVESVPMILMTGFGYDPGHTIVKARQLGLPANAILYKPFRLDQLLETVEAMIATRKVPQA
ncbi:MAG: response regulator [Pirellulaceae bacterium]|nr:response regulator [Pirellulaceae bacterium]